MLRLIYSFIGIFGAIIGSFMNVLILRKSATGLNSSLPNSLNGRSQCPNCHHQLSAIELIPVLSFFMQAGKCIHCHQKISLQYPLVELIMAISAILIFTPLPSNYLSFISALVLVLIVSLLIILFTIDLYTFLLPDIYIGLLSLIVIVSLIISRSSIFYSLTGLAIGAGFLLALWIITKGQGIGLGDVKLLIPLGALFGPHTTGVLLFLSFIIGGLLGIYLLISKRAGLKTAVPFGPFLTGVAIIFILWPEIPSYIINFIIP